MLSTAEYSVSVTLILSVVALSVDAGVMPTKPSPVLSSHWLCDFRRGGGFLLLIMGGVCTSLILVLPWELIRNQVPPWAGNLIRNHIYTQFVSESFFFNLILVGWLIDWLIGWLIFGLLTLFMEECCGHISQLHNSCARGHALIESSRFVFHKSF